VSCGSFLGKDAKGRNHSKKIRERFGVLMWEPEEMDGRSMKRSLAGQLPSWLVAHHS